MRKLFIALAAIVVLMLLGGIFLPQILARLPAGYSNSTIGIIGGADGPTSVIVEGERVETIVYRQDNPMTPLILAPIILIVAVVIFAAKRRK